MKLGMISRRLPLITAALLGLSIVASLSHSLETAQVTGLITDAAGAGVPRASVFFSSAGKKSTVVTDSYGTYAVHLQPGMYEMYVKAWGFYDMRRAAFSVAAGTKVNFDFKLLTAVISDPVTTGRTDVTEPPNAPISDPYNYQQELLEFPIDNNARPLVLFGSREQHEGEILFRGLARDGKQLPVVYTYDLLTVSSETLTYFSKDGSVRGSGDVAFEDGQHARHGSRIDISFHDGKPEVKLTQ